MISSCSSFPFVSWKASFRWRALWVNAEEQAGRESSGILLFHQRMGWGSGIIVPKSSICCAELWSVPGHPGVGTGDAFHRRRHSFPWSPACSSTGCWVRLKELTSPLFTHSWNCPLALGGRWGCFAMEFLPLASVCVILLSWKQGHGDEGMTAAAGPACAWTSVWGLKTRRRRDSCFSAWLGPLWATFLLSHHCPVRKVEALWPFYSSG